MHPFLRRSMFIALLLCLAAVSVAGYAREKSRHTEVVGWADAWRADGTFGGGHAIEAQVPSTATQVAWESMWLLTLVVAMVALMSSPQLVTARPYMWRAAVIGAGVELAFGIQLLLHGYAKTTLATSISRIAWPLGVPLTPFARLVGLDATAIVAPLLAGVVYGTLVGSVWGLFRRPA